jgi:glycosyltransferase involved in cell wall biosynthesis
MVVVAQLGARMHYAVPAILERSGMLERLYTDIYAPPLPKPMRKLASRYGPNAVRRWLGRTREEIPRHKVIPFSTIAFEYLRRKKSAKKDRALITAADLWAGTELCRRAVKAGLGGAHGVYTFNSAGLELMQYARERGLYAITEQTCAPSRIYERTLDEEGQLNPLWEAPREKDEFRDKFDERELAEWKTADVVLCASEFVRKGVEACGGPLGKCCVVPYGVGAPPPSFRTKERQSRPLRVLTVGAVGLRKGAPYVLAAARALKGRAEFSMAGQLDITPYAQKLLSEHVTLLGAVPRSEIHRQFEWADVFLLPTLCEGSATVCYEALSHGIPVITTANAGSVVRDGIDGFIVPIRDAEAIADRLEHLAADEHLWSTMANNAQSRALEYTVEKYGERLLNAIRSHCNPDFERFGLAAR